MRLLSHLRQSPINRRQSEDCHGIVVVPVGPQRSREHDGCRVRERKGAYGEQQQCDSVLVRNIRHRSPRFPKQIAERVESLNVCLNQSCECSRTAA